jgi:hypothetical protein
MGQAAAQGEVYWRVHVEAWRASGQSRGEYCAAHGLARKTFGWWAWRLGRQEHPGKRGRRQTLCGGSLRARLNGPVRVEAWRLGCRKVMADQAAGAAV